MKIQDTFTVQNENTPEGLSRFLNIFSEDVRSVVNGNLNFQDNISCFITAVSFPTADVTVGIAHNLGRIPIGYVLIRSPAATILYDGSEAFTRNTLSLRSTVALNNVTVLIF